MKRALSFSALLAGSAVMLPGMALAQAQAPATAAAAETASSDVIVTAQKRSEKLQDVPVQVDVLTASTIQARQIKMTSDIVSTVPNLSVERTDTYTNSVIVLRGLFPFPHVCPL